MHSPTADAKQVCKQRAWPGAAVVSQPFELLDGLAIAKGATQSAIYARFAAMLQQNMGLVGNTADEIDYALVPNNSLFVDDVTRQIFQWRNGVLETVFVVGLDFNPAGPWSGPAERHALSIAGSPGRVAIDYDDGVLVDGIAYFSLNVDASAELQLPTNAPLDAVIDILYTQDGGDNKISHASGYTITDAIRETDTARTRIRYTVTEVGGSPEEATELTGAPVTFDENDLVEDRGFLYFSNIDDNDAEPQLDGSGDAESDLNWTVKPLGAGAEVTATSATSLAIPSAMPVDRYSQSSSRAWDGPLIKDCAPFLPQARRTSWKARRFFPA